MHSKNNARSMLDGWSTKGARIAFVVELEQKGKEKNKRKMRNFCVW
jgi:hypothetical protein